METKEELRKPEEWQKEFGFKVVSSPGDTPFGWKGAGTPWDEPISRQDFILLAGRSRLEFK